MTAQKKAHLAQYLMLSTFICCSLPHAQFMLYKPYDLRVSIAFLPTVCMCNMHATEVDVVCVPWVTLNRDIIGHYRPLLSMVNDQICPAIILTRSQPITITTLNGLNIDCVRLNGRKQQQMANFPELHNLLLLLYILAFSDL